MSQHLDGLGTEGFSILFVVTQEDAEQEAQRERAKQMNPLKKSYFCPDCDKQYDFTTTEILKHKKSHLTGTQVNSS